jgi:hypothetical protein
MLQALLKQCSWQCSSTASSNAQACILLARGWCARPMTSVSRSCAAVVAEVGAVTGPILDSKLCR